MFSWFTSNKDDRPAPAMNMNPTTNHHTHNQQKPGRRTNKTLNFHTVTFSQGAGFRVPSKEDRILAIEDLYNYVHTYHSTYKTDLFGDISVPDAPSPTFIVPKVPGSNEVEHLFPFYNDYENTVDASGFPRTDTVRSDASIGSNIFPDTEALLGKFKLFAVFDGHCGKFAASYLQYRFPFQLCGCELFKQGKYEEALKDTYAKLHASLKECTKYGPERPYSDYASGSTASVVLVTPTMTYFAYLGDSPILTWKHSEEKPDILFNEHDADNPKVHRNLLDSNIFLVLVRERISNIVYYLVTQPIVKEALFRMALSQHVEGGATDPAVFPSEIGQTTPLIISPEPISMMNSRQESKKKKTKPHSGENYSAFEEEQVQAGEEIEHNLPFISLQNKDTLAPDSAHSLDEGLNTMLLNSDLEEEDLTEDTPPVKLKTFQESRLSDDNEDCIVKTEEEFLKEEHDKLSKSMATSSLNELRLSEDVQTPFTNDNLMFSQHYPYSYPGMPDPFALQGETLEYDDIRVGLSALNVYGTLGDSSYDPDVFNAFIDEIVDFKADQLRKFEQLMEEKQHMETANFTVMSSPTGVFTFTSKSLSSNNAGSGNTSPRMGSDRAAFDEFDPTDFSYEDFRDFVKARPTWEFLKKHMFLLKDEEKCSRVLLAAIKYLNSSHKLSQTGLLRVPETTSIPNSELKMFIITSDGVIRFYDKFKDQFQNMIMANEHQPEKLANKLKDYMKWLGDDRSIIICRYGSIPKKPSTPKVKLVNSKKRYGELRNKKSTVTLPPTPLPI